MIDDLNIIHMDMDAFFASVEEMDNPNLKGKPVIVGGRSNRGIVTTANYEARKYGVHSAMPIFIAKQKCPNAIYLPVRKERYSEISKKVFEIVYSVTDLVEPLSIDEAYIDISNLEKNAVEIAEYIRNAVFQKFGLTMSFGISYNKFLAKLASDWQKPSGLTIIKREDVPEILLPLPIGKIYGIGKKSEEKLNNIGIYTVEDLMNLSEGYLSSIMGKSGREVYFRIRGIDDRTVEPNRIRKSVGTERTFRPTRDKKFLIRSLREYAKELADIMDRKNIRGKTLTLKIKYEDFSSHTKSTTLEEYIFTEDRIFEISKNLLDEMPLEHQVRLLGVSVSNLVDGEYIQMSFFDN